MSSFSIGQRGTMPYRSRLGWLPASLGLNLVLAGIVLAWALNLPSPPRQAIVTWQREMTPSLSESDAVLARDATGQIADAQAAGDAAVHAQYNKVRKLLAVEPLDKTALQAAFAEITVIRRDQQMSIGAAFFDELSNVSPDGRRKILAAMEKESLRWHPTPGR